jgi:hypothetical protein
LKKIVTIVLFFLMAISVFGCSNNKKENRDENLTQDQPIDILVEIEQGKDNLNAVTFRATARRNGEKLDGIDSIKFEIWKKGQEHHEMIKGDKVSTGVYEAKNVYHETGVYFVMYHINDVSGIHHMDRMTFMVGDIEPESHSNENDENHNNHGEETDIMIHNMPNQATVNREVTLMAHIGKAGEALLGAKVRFEIIISKEEKTFIDATELDLGKHVATFTFEKQGSFTIVTHVEKSTEHIHEHKEWIITVK